MHRRTLHTGMRTVHCVQQPSSVESIFQGRATPPPAEITDNTSITANGIHPNPKKKET